MKKKKTKKTCPPELREKLTDLEETASQKGIFVHYDLLEAAGLKLKGGICKIKGEYHLFIDKRKSPQDKIDILHDYLQNPLPEDIPEFSE